MILNNANPADTPQDTGQHPAAAPSLKTRALRLLGRREHSRLELERKLRPHEQTPGELAQTLDWLEQRGFINAQRVVESLLNRRAPLLGAARVQQELQARGLDRDLIASAMLELRESEPQRARAVLEKKFGIAPANDAKERARRMRFLSARGFSPEVVRKVTSAADE